MKKVLKLSQDEMAAIVGSWAASGAPMPSVAKNSKAVKVNCSECGRGADDHDDGPGYCGYCGETNGFEFEVSLDEVEPKKKSSKK